MKANRDKFETLVGCGGQSGSWTQTGRFRRMRSPRFSSYCAWNFSAIWALVISAVVVFSQVVRLYRKKLRSFHTSSYIRRHDPVIRTAAKLLNWEEVLVIKCLYRWKGLNKFQKRSDLRFALSFSCNNSCAEVIACSFRLVGYIPYRPKDLSQTSPLLELYLIFMREIN